MPLSLAIDVSQAYLRRAWAGGHATNPSSSPSKPDRPHNLRIETRTLGDASPGGHAVKEPHLTCVLSRSYARAPAVFLVLERPDLMSLPLVFAIAAATGFSLLDVLRKSLASGFRPFPLLVFVAFTEAPLFLVWGLFDQRPLIASTDYFIPGAGILLLHGLANLFFLFSVRWGPLGKTVPFLALSPIFAALLGSALLGERLSFVQWCGVFSVLLGGLVLGYGELRSRSDDRRVLLAQLLMVGVAFAWAGSTVIDKKALAYASPGGHGFAINMMMGGIALLILCARGELGELRIKRGQLPAIVALAPVGTAALGAQYLALAGLEAGIVEGLKRAIGTALAFVFGTLFFRERFAFGHLPALALLILGIWLVQP